MGNDLPTRVPKPLDQRALERVLARAAELQGTEGELPEGLTDAQLIDLGKEVGIDAAHLRRALAEERARPSRREEGWFAERIAGPSGVSAERVVSGTPGSVLARLDRHMQRDEVLTLKRQRPDQLVWEAQRGLLGGLRRGFALSGKNFHLTGASDVSAQVSPVDERTVVLRLNADFAREREKRMAVAGLSWVGLMLLCAPLFVMGVGIALAVLPPVALTFAAIQLLRRRHLSVLNRSQVALEQLLDRLELGDGR